jgi:hypothetical protein
MPGKAVHARQPFSFDDALTTVTLTFRDAADVLWVRLPGGHLSEQAGPTTRDSILTAIKTAQPGPPAANAKKGNAGGPKQQLTLPWNRHQPDPATPQANRDTATQATQT